MTCSFENVTVVQGLDVERAIDAEGFDEGAGAGVQSVEVVFDGRVDAPIVAIRPVQKTAHDAAGAFVMFRRVYPCLPARIGFQGEDLSVRRDAVEQTVDNDGVGLNLGFAAAVVGPHRFELRDVLHIDLVQPGVMRAVLIAEVPAPLLLVAGPPPPGVYGRRSQKKTKQN